MGRSRSRQASIAAAMTSMPPSTRSRANSTIRIAFLQASPTSTMKPICVRMLLSEPDSHTPSIADSRHMGTMRMIASGSDQLSYCAARIRKTSSTHSAKTSGAISAVDFC